MSLKKNHLLIVLALLATTPLMAMKRNLDADDLSPAKKQRIEALAQEAFLSIGIHTACGKLHANEDTYVCTNLPHEEPGVFLLAAIFDGHGGSEVSHYLQENFAAIFSGYLAQGHSVKDALVNSFVAADINAIPLKYQGSCALVCVIRNNELTIAHAGDTRGVIFFNDGKTQNKLYTKDHKPDAPEEKERIEKAGGSVFIDRKTARVSGATKLAVSRSLGDYRENGERDVGLSCMPSITERTFDSSCKFIILASDGIWDVMTNDEAISEVKKILLIGSASSAAKRLVGFAQERESKDDLTVIVIKL